MVIKTQQTRHKMSVIWFKRLITLLLIKDIVKCFF